MGVGGGCCLRLEPRLQRAQSGRRGRNRLVAFGRLVVAVVVGIPVDVVDVATVVLPVYVVLLVFLVCVAQIRLCLVRRGRLRRTRTRARG